MVCRWGLLYNYTVWYGWGGVNCTTKLPSGIGRMAAALVMFVWYLLLPTVWYKVDGCWSGHVCLVSTRPYHLVYGGYLLVWTCLSGIYSSLPSDIRLISAGLVMFVWYQPLPPVWFMVDICWSGHVCLVSSPPFRLVYGRYLLVWSCLSRIYSSLLSGIRWMAAGLVMFVWHLLFPTVWYKVDCCWSGHVCLVSTPPYRLV